MKRFIDISAALLATLVLAGCSTAIPTIGTTSAPPATSAPIETTEPATPTPTLTQKQTSGPVDPIETHKPTGLPTSCDELGSAPTRMITVDNLGFFPDVPVPTIIQGADVLVQCYWFAGDVTGVDLVIATVQEPDAVAVLDNAEAQGFTCDGQNGYTMCRLDEEAKYFDNPYTVTSFYLYGSGVWLEAVGSNMDITTLIDEIAVSIWQ